MTWRQANAIRALSFAACFLFLLFVLAACAPLEQKPQEPIIEVEFRDVPTPVPVLCINKADIPKMPTPTPVDLVNATPKQIAAANEADIEALRLYAEAVDRLFIQCTKGAS